MNNIPDLWVSNSFVWELFGRVSGQVIVAGMGEPLGIKFEAIAFLFDLYNIDYEYRVDLFEKIQIIDGVRMSYRKQEIIKQQQKSKSKTNPPK